MWGSGDVSARTELKVGRPGSGVREVSVFLLFFGKRGQGVNHQGETVGFIHIRTSVLIIHPKILDVKSRISTLFILIMNCAIILTLCAVLV